MLESEYHRVNGDETDLLTCGAPAEEVPPVSKLYEPPDSIVGT